jgi:single-strand DNA-binding protein
MNSSVLMGRLTKDIELKFAQGSGNAIAKFTVAVNRSFKNAEGGYDADFINCLAFGKRAETINQYFHKGQRILLRGRIQTGSYDAQDGTKRYTTEVLVEDFSFIESNNQSNNQANASVDDGIHYDDDITPVDDGDLPF